MIMKTTERVFRLSALSAALFAVYGAAIADDAEIARLTKPESSASIGVGNWSGDRHQLGIYDGQRESGVYINAEVDLVNRDEQSGTSFTLRGRNLGLDTPEMRGEYLRQGDFGVSFEYGITRRDNPNTFVTGLQGIGTTSMTVSGPAGLFPKTNVTLGTEREATQVGIYKNLTSTLDLNVTFKNEDKTGTRHWGLGSQPYFVAEPINSTIQQMDFVLNHSGERLQVSGGYSGSFYRSHNDLVTTRINRTAATNSTSDPNPVPLTEPLDNQAHQLFVDAGYSFTPSTRATAKVSYTRATQDEDLPTWGLAVPNDRFVGTPSSLDGRIDTTLVQLGLTSRPLQKLSLLANVRYYDVDDKTPLKGFVGNNATGVATVHNTPHSIKTKSGKFEATYQLPAQINLAGGLEHSTQDRSFPAFEIERFVPFRAELDETTYRLQLRRTMGETLNGSIGYAHSKRDGSDFELTEHFPSDLINPIHIADRERNKVRATFGWTPVDKLSVDAVAEASKDEYGHSATRIYGVREGTGRFYSLDANYALTENWSFSAWFSHDETKADQRNARWDRATDAYEIDKTAHLRDEGDSVGVGTRGKVGSKVKLGADAQWTRNRSEFPTVIDPNGPGKALTPDPDPAVTILPVTSPLPDVESKVIRLSLFGQYALDKQSDIRFDFIHERWQSNDWTYLNSTGAPFTYGGTSGIDGTIVLAPNKEISNFVGARYSYRFE
jgi:MtrB/PioB family decaheme-associated outer membrane protein